MPPLRPPLRAAVIAALLVLALALVGALLLRHKLSARLVAAAEARLGSLGASVSMASVGPAWPLGVSIRDVRLALPDGVAVDARAVRIQLSLRALLAGRIVPRGVEVSGAAVRGLWGPRSAGAVAASEGGEPAAAGILDEGGQRPPPPEQAPGADSATDLRGGPGEGASDPPPGRLARAARRLAERHHQAATQALKLIERLAPRLEGPLPLRVEDLALEAGAGMPILSAVQGEVTLPLSAPDGVAFDVSLQLQPVDADLDADAEVDQPRLSLASPGEVQLVGWWWPASERLEAHAVVEGLQPVMAAAAERISAWPSLFAELDVSVEAAEITVQGEGAARGLSVVHPRISTVPVGPMDLSAALAVSMRGIASPRIDLSQWDGRVNGIPYRMSGAVGEGVGGWFDLKLTAERLPFQDLLKAIPEAVVPEIADYRLGGALDLSLSAQGRLDHLEGMELSWDGDLGELSLLKGRLDPVPSGYPLEGVLYQPVDPAMADRAFRLGRGHPGWIPLEAVPQHCIDAVVMAEDASFFHHQGFDVAALKGALSDNLEEGRTVRGGSTITQQLAKNLYLSGERTVARKLQEAVLTWELELRLSKRQILETYLNIIEWGPGLYGIGAASQHFFGRPPSQLSVKQCVYLATVIPGPRKYYVYYLRGELSDNWREQVDQLLGKLWEFDRISLLQYQSARAEEVRFVKPLPEEGEGASSPRRRRQRVGPPR